MSRLPNWLTPAALGVSLLVNLGLGGYVIGQHLRPEPPAKERPHRKPEFERPEGIPELSREDRRQVRQLMRQGFGAAQVELAERREAEKHFASVLMADPYDRMAAEVALRELRDADVRLRDRIGLEVLGGVDQLRPDQRAWVAWILSGPKEGDHGKHKSRRAKETPPEGPQD
ncbi:periplasmic heavy metal sensor [Hyphomonas sp. WL0036]|uniref:periplasmic heavy metal sensor n=1 Tax=Hyphomonas sediminis TaxID=2866160 RepID=UPI001C7ECF99|nr:periplasmic heavy metal sensor [Hyphomonas sediminis]MBY9067314.1 periplasmic heavy metal sensor [Hyphomonas sediminis]